MLNEISGDILSVRGNCDAEVDNMVLDFDVSANCLLLSADGVDYYATHGHLPVPPLKAGTVLLFGHTHVPVFKEEDGIFILNPGSVSIPKMDSDRGYIVIKNGKTVRKNLDGEITFEADF